MRYVPSADTASILNTKVLNVNPHAWVIPLLYFDHWWVDSDTVTLTAVR